MRQLHDTAATAWLDDNTAVPNISDDLGRHSVSRRSRRAPTSNIPDLCQILAKLQGSTHLGRDGDVPENTTPFQRR